MKCKYCNADIEQDAQFCPNCGKDLSKFNRCVNCGELLDRDTVFCPYCGTEQTKKDEVIEQKQNSFNEPQQEELVDTPQPYEETKSKKGLWIFGAILLLCAIVGAGYYFFNMSGGNDAYIAASDTIEADAGSAENVSDLHSVEGIKTRLDEIISKGMSMSDEEAVKKYFSKDYQEIFFKVEDYDKKNVPQGDIGFWDMSIWGDGQGGIGNFHSVIKDVKNVTENKASAIVEYISDDNMGEKLVTLFDLCYEDDNWRIDEIKDDNGFIYKKKMKEYLEESNPTTDSKTISNGTYTLAGKVSKYAIHMNIEINGSDVKGYYYYDSQGSGNKVKLSGSLNEDGELMLNKFSNEGKETGYFEGIFNGIEYSGKNVNYNRDEYLPFSVTVE